MARKTETRVIEEKSFTLKALGGRLGAEGLRRLGGTAGPAIAAAVATMRPGGIQENLPALLGGAAGLLGKLSADDFAWFCTEFGKSATVKIGPVDVSVDSQFDEIFSANYMDLVEFLGASLSLNYGNFMSAAATKFTAAMSAAEVPAAQA